MATIDTRTAEEIKAELEGCQPTEVEEVVEVKEGE